MEIPETRLARTGGGTLAYQLVGEGAVDIFFVAEVLQNIDVMWQSPSITGYMRGLASLGRLVCFDKRGHGVSDTLDGSGTNALEQWVDDTREMMDALQTQQAILIGDGLSAPIAIMFAATYPERVRALIIQNGCARFLRDEDYEIGFPTELVPRFMSAFERAYGTGATLEITAPQGARDHEFRRWWGWYERLCARPTGIVEGFGTFVLRTDVRAALDSILAPTLIVHREGNRFMRAAHGRYLADHIPHATYRELPGDDHLFHAGDYDGLLAEIGEFLTGVREAPEPDRMLATVLFTDIVDSTGRTAALGDARWREVLAAHNAVVRGQLARFRGREVNTTGDGFVATFDGPARAIRCASAITEEIRSLGIEVRAGLHTGECERFGTDIGGIAVDIAARVTALASAGEVLVSSTVKDLVVGSEIEFEDRGTQELKGVPGTWRLHAVSS